MVRHPRLDCDRWPPRGHSLEYLVLADRAATLRQATGSSFQSGLTPCSALRESARARCLTQRSFLHHRKSALPTCRFRGQSPTLGAPRFDGSVRKLAQAHHAHAEGTGLSHKSYRWWCSSAMSALETRTRHIGDGNTPTINHELYVVNQKSKQTTLAHNVDHPKHYYRVP